MSRRSVKTLTIAACSMPVAGVVLAAAAMPAQATVPAAPSEDGVTHSTMYVGGIDEARARLAGNEVRIEGADKVLIDGETGEVLAKVSADPSLARQSAISKSLASVGSDSMVTPYMYYEGNCGDSWVDLWSAGTKTVDMETGFDLASGNVAYDINWTVRFVEGATILGYYGKTELTAPTSYWDSGAVRRTYKKAEDHVTAQVITGQAILTDGSVCYSGLPQETLDW